MNEISSQEWFEVQSLYARYAHAIDTGDGPTWARCYTPEGTYWSSTFGTQVGRDALEKFAEKHYQEWEERGITTQHWINQSRLIRESWGIRGATYVQLIGVRKAGPPRAMLQTTYHDRIVRHEGEWLLERRESRADCALALVPTVDS